MKRKLLLAIFFLFLVTAISFAIFPKIEQAAFIPPGSGGAGGAPSCPNTSSLQCMPGYQCSNLRGSGNATYSCGTGSTNVCCSIPTPTQTPPACAAGYSTCYSGVCIHHTGCGTGNCTINANCSTSSTGSNGTGTGTSGSGSGTGNGTCFPAGTKISMADGSQKNIEDVKVGEEVIGYDETHNRNAAETVKQTQIKISDNLYSIHFIDDAVLQVTSNHPLYTLQGWKSIDPDITRKETPGLPVSKLEVGDAIRRENGSYDKITRMDYIPESILTYNLRDVADYNNFFADSFLAHNYTATAGKQTAPPTYYSCTYTGSNYMCDPHGDSSCKESPPGSGNYINVNGNQCLPRLDSCNISCKLGMYVKVNPLDNDPYSGTVGCGPAGQGGACWKGGCPTGTHSLDNNSSAGICGSPGNGPGTYPGNGLCCVPDNTKTTACQTNGDVCVPQGLVQSANFKCPTNGQPPLSGNGFQCNVGNVCCAQPNYNPGTGKNYCGQCAGNTCSKVGAFCLQATNTCGSDNSFAVYTCDKTNDLWQFKYTQTGGGGCTCNDTGGTNGTSSSICTAISNANGGTTNVATCGSSIQGNADTLYSCSSNNTVTSKSCNGAGCTQCGVGFNDVCGSSPLNCSVNSPEFIKFVNQNGNKLSTPVLVCGQARAKKLNFLYSLCASNYGIAGAQPNTLYDCTNNVVLQDCSKSNEICTTSSSGGDSCASNSNQTSVTNNTLPICNAIQKHGDQGFVCGTSSHISNIQGVDSNTLYNCTAGYFNTQYCPQGCTSTGSSGTSDSCITNSSGSIVSPTSINLTCDTSGNCNTQSVTTSTAAIQWNNDRRLNVARAGNSTKVTISLNPYGTPLNPFTSTIAFYDPKSGATQNVTVNVAFKNSQTSTTSVVQVSPSTINITSCSQSKNTCIPSTNFPITITLTSGPAVQLQYQPQPSGSFLSVSPTTNISLSSANPSANITVTIFGNKLNTSPNAVNSENIIFTYASSNNIGATAVDIPVQVNSVTSSTFLASRVLSASTASKPTQFPTILSFYPANLAESTKSNLLAKVLAAQVYAAKDTLTYDPKTGYFVNPKFNTNTIPPGNYKVFVHVDKYLDAQLLQSDGSDTFNQQIGSPLSPKVANITPGDVAPAPHGDNIIDIQDYNAMVSCITGIACNNKSLYDLDNNGKVDSRDLDILVSHFGESGASFGIPEFTCVTDPQCAKDSTKTIQLCPLKCTRITQNRGF